MPSFFNLFRRGNNAFSTQDNIIQDLDKIQEIQESVPKISEIRIDEDNSGNDLLFGNVESISESVVYNSPDSITDMLTSGDTASNQILNELRAVGTLDETYRENEEMAKDSVVGGSMETIADDACQIDETTNKIVMVESSDAGLAKFLQDFLDDNVNIADRVWTWTLEVIKHGDFKLRRREYYLGSKRDGVKNVFYEDVVNPYKVTRIEYMGKILGFRDEDRDENRVTFERPDEFVHFMSVKNSNREKVHLSIRNEDNQMEDVTCYKVFGTSIMDNARYIFRVVNLLDNMLILSRVARSTQFNLVKVEVGNASTAKTQQILSDVRRRLEGTTKMKKNVGMRSDPSPIPVNTNVYIPTREGKGDINVESVNDNVDVRSITDIDYFKDKEFATVKTPKVYLGFGDDSMNSLANNSLVRMDSRYARSVQRVQNVMINGIKALCNNYLSYRGRKSDINNFTIKMRPLDTADTMNRIEELVTKLQAMDAMNGMTENYKEYIDRAKMFISMANLVGLSPSEIGSKELLQIIDEINKGTYDPDKYKPAEPEEDEDSKW